MELMLDMEFLDTLPSAAILSIGAVWFDPHTGKLGNEFYTTVSADDCVRRHGMTISADTVRWWIEQDHKAIKKAFAVDECMMLELALVKLANFMSSTPKEKIIIHTMGSLDLQILKSAWAKLPKGITPWNFRNERDTRTLRELFPQIKVPNVGTAHNALDDAKYQANLTSAIYKHIAKLNDSTPVDKPKNTSAKDDEL